MSRIDITKPIQEVCEALGLELKNVARLDLTPGHVTATLYRENENGQKHIDVDTGEAAMETREFEVWV